MRTIDKQFIGYRAEQLAIVRLTDRDDLHLKAMDTDYGLDFLVSVLRKGKDIGLLFGVQVKGVMSNDTLASIKPNRLPVSNLPFPVIMLVFTMDKDEAFWAWVKSPVEGAQLKNGTSELRPLTDERLSGILNEIVAWYDSRRVNAAA